MCVRDAKHTYNSLLFGWKYSPLLCQPLVYNNGRYGYLVATVLFFIYVDDIFIVGTTRLVKRAVQRAKRGLKKAGFIMSHKFETQLERHSTLEVVHSKIDRGCCEAL